MYLVWVWAQVYGNWLINCIWEFSCNFDRNNHIEYNTVTRISDVYHVNKLFVMRTINNRTILNEFVWSQNENVVWKILWNWRSVFSSVAYIGLTMISIRWVPPSTVSVPLTIFIIVIPSLILSQDSWQHDLWSISFQQIHDKKFMMKKKIGNDCYVKIEAALKGTFYPQNFLL